MGERELAKEEETIEGFLFTDSPSVVAPSASSPVVTTDADVFRMVLVRDKVLIENELHQSAKYQTSEWGQASSSRVRSASWAWQSSRCCSPDFGSASSGSGGRLLRSAAGIKYSLLRMCLKHLDNNVILPPRAH